MNTTDKPKKSRYNRFSLIIKSGILITKELVIKEVAMRREPTILEVLTTTDNIKYLENYMGRMTRALTIINNGAKIILSCVNIVSLELVNVKVEGELKPYVKVEIQGIVTNKRFQFPLVSQDLIQDTNVIGLGTKITIYRIQS